MDPQAEHKHLPVLIIILLVVLVFATVLIWYLLPPKKAVAPQQALPTSNSTSSNETNASLGAEIYSKTANPVEGKIPSASPAPENPIEKVYKNPFE